MTGLEYIYEFMDMESNDMRARREAQEEAEHHAAHKAYKKRRKLYKKLTKKYPNWREGAPNYINKTNWADCLSYLEEVDYSITNLGVMPNEVEQLDIDDNGEPIPVI
jgi:hypothetical protein